jgi:hypothetical protein
VTSNLSLTGTFTKDAGCFDTAMKFTPNFYCRWSSTPLCKGATPSKTNQARCGPLLKRAQILIY